MGDHTHIVLVGFMGSGKSSVARELSALTGMECVDMDALIEQESGTSVSRIFENEGEVGFRDRETKVLESLLERQHCIISCGGGVVVREQNRSLLKQLGTVIYLQVSAQAAMDRLRLVKDRPLLKGAISPELLLEQRLCHYEEVADFSVDTTAMNVSEVSQLLYERLKEQGLL